MKEIGYNRAAALEYAKRWALGRNPSYLDFEKMGGDCTNFASQCIYAGCGVMNHTETFGWYYHSGNDKAPAWSGVAYLYNFLTMNKGVGPFAREVSLEQAEIGDIVQLGEQSGRFYHSPVITAVSHGEILVAAHSFDAYMRPLSSYQFAQARCIHILGARR